MYPSSFVGQDPFLIPFFLYVLNPIDSDFTLTSIKAQVYSTGPFGEQRIADVDQTLDYTIAPHTTSLSPLLYSNSNIYEPPFGDAGFPGFAVQETGRIKAIGYGSLTLVTTITGFIGDYPVATSYTQADVYTYIAPGPPPANPPPEANPNPVTNPNWLTL
jgi:hypothetical protein